MRTSVKAGVVFSLIWIIAVLTAFLAGYSVDLFIILELFSLFTLLGAIFTGLFLTKKENGYEKVNALEDFKVAMQSGLIYTIIITAFVYIYHNNIDPSVKETFTQERIAKLHEQYPTKETYLELQANDPKWETFSYDDFIENQEDQIATFVGSFFTTLVHLMVHFMFSLFYSFFVMIVLRKVILRNA